MSDTPRTNRAAYYMGRTGDDKDAHRWCDLLNESRSIELDLIEARKEAEWWMEMHCNGEYTEETASRNLPWEKDEP